MKALLVLDAYTKAGRAALTNAGGTEAGELYRALLSRLEPGLTIDVAHPADGPLALPDGVALVDYDGVVWTGSSLTIHREDDPAVVAQVELARELRRIQRPSFGSCWAVQIAMVAAGGRCGPHPGGREFGVSTGISLSASGREHPLYRGKPERFSAFTSHADHVVTLASGAELLAGNAWSEVQAAAVEGAGHSFWAVQYHPEYDPHEVASLARLRRDELVAQGHFESDGSALAWIEGMESIAEDPGNRALASSLGVDETLLDPDVRTLEVRNWLHEKVLSIR